MHNKAESSQGAPSLLLQLIGSSVTHDMPDAASYLAAYLVPVNSLACRKGHRDIPLALIFALALLPAGATYMIYNTAYSSMHTKSLSSVPDVVC